MPRPTWPKKCAIRGETCRWRSPSAPPWWSVIYVLINALYLYVIPIAELAQVKGSVLDVVADRLLGARAGDIMGVVSLVSLAAGIKP